MTHFRTVSVLALVSMAAPAMALDIGGGFSLTGNLEYERLESAGSGSSGINIGFLDADLTYLHSSGFGGFVGVDSISAGSSDTFEGFYGALSYTGDFGRIQIGAPRSVIGDYVVTPEVGTSDYLDFAFAQFSGALLPFLVLSEDDTAAGVRYDGTFGAMAVGLSYHRIDDVNVFSAAMTYGFDRGKLMASTEHLSDSMFSGSRFSIGGEYNFGQVTTGVVFSTDNNITDADTIEAYAVYSPTDRLDLTATAINVSLGGMDATIYGLGVNFDLSESVYVEAGYVGGNNFLSSNDLYTVGLGVNF